MRLLNYQKSNDPVRLEIEVNEDLLFAVYVSFRRIVEGRVVLLFDWIFAYDAGSEPVYNLLQIHPPRVAPLRGIDELVLSMWETAFNDCGRQLGRRADLQMGVLDKLVQHYVGVWKRAGDHAAADKWLAAKMLKLRKGDRPIDRLDDIHLNNTAADVHSK